MTDLTTPNADRIARITEDLRLAYMTMQNARAEAERMERTPVRASESVHSVHAQRRQDEQRAALDYTLKAASTYADAASRDLFNLTAPANQQRTTDDR